MPESAELYLRLDARGPIINPNLHGHFAEHLGACIYDGLWVGEASSIENENGLRTDVLRSLGRLEIPVLRWPGGCFADEYHWRDGIGRRGERKRRINTHWGKVVETNQFGTHEFLDLCERLGAAPYICGNVGSGTVQEMMDWVEYLTAPGDSDLAALRRENGREKPWQVPFFGVGNENWGCGGHMRPEYYADEFRRYATYVENHGDNAVYRIACGSSGVDFDWTRVMMERGGPRMDGLSLHWYTLPTGDWQHKGKATEFEETEWHSTLRRALHMEQIVSKHSAIMDERDPDRRVGLVVDEWGTWYDVEPGTNPAFLCQQNTLRDALVAAISLDIFHAHAERVVMANIAQLVNVLQAVVLTDGPRLLETPTFHTFEMYKVHRSCRFVPVELRAPSYDLGEASLPMLHASASRMPDGNVHLSVTNLDPNRDARVLLTGGAALNFVSGRILTANAIDAHNTFDEPECVRPAPFGAVERHDGDWVLALPAKSIVVLGFEMAA